MSALDRKAAGIFNYENGVGVEEFYDCDTPEKYLIPADDAVSFEKLVLTEKQATKILNGVYENYGFKDGIYRVYNQSEFWGVGESLGGVLRINAYVR